MLISGTIISAGKTVMASEYKGRATVAMGKEVELPHFNFMYQQFKSHCGFKSLAPHTHSWEK